MLAQVDGLESACGAEDPSRVCTRVYDWTGNETLAGLSEELAAGTESRAR